MFYLKPWISKITSTIPVEYDEENYRTLREVETKGIEIYFLGLHFSIGIRVKETDFRPFLKKKPPKPSSKLKKEDQLTGSTMTQKQIL